MATRVGKYLRTLVVGSLVFGGVIVASVIGGSLPASATIDGVATCSAGTCTASFQETGATHGWTVPAGVTSIGVTLYGANGGTGGEPGGAGGLGAEVTGSLAVSGGEALTVNVGGVGGGAETNATANGGYGGGGSGGNPVGGTVNGGGGGGATDLSYLSAAVSAGGGGGGGGGGSSGGGSGGNADQGGGPGSPYLNLGAGGGGSSGDSGGGGGTGGTGTSGLCGTTHSGASGGDGSSGTGGQGNTNAGGGGGGLVGGGAGGEPAAGVDCRAGAGGGGGGSSSDNASGFSNASIISGADAVGPPSSTGGNGEAIFTYGNPVAAGSPTYSATAGETLTVTGAAGLLAGSSGPAADTLTVAPVTGEATSQGGSVTIDADGSFTYTPLASFTGTDSFPFTVLSGDSAGDYADGTASVMVEPAGPNVTITTTTLPDGTLRRPYSFQLEATGGTPPYTWNKYGPVGMGTLPVGVGIAPSGLISGTPKRAGTYTFVVKCLDSSHSHKTQGTQKLTLTINP